MLRKRIKNVSRKFFRKIESGADKVLKKKAVLYGNCHMNLIEMYLQKSVSFSARYYILQIPLFYEGGEALTQRDLRNCKLFIYQEVREKNKYGYEYCSDYLMSMLPNNCLRVQVPNLYELGYGFFPQNLVYPGKTGKIKFQNDYNPNYHGDERGLFVHGDKYIQNMINQAKPLNVVIEQLKGEVIPKYEILELFDIYIRKIEEREKKWDIKILDYLFKNYKDFQVFNDFGHPSNRVIKEITSRLLEYINLDDDIKDIYVDTELDEYEDPIYPCVASALGLKYQKKYLRKYSDKKIRNDMDYEEYIKEYYYWCWPDNRM